MSVVTLTPPLNIGDIVKLNSGGLAMTVASVERKKNAWTIGVKWHSVEDTMQEDYLQSEMLHIAPADEVNESLEDETG